jgi:hypothetical protein
MVEFRSQQRSSRTCAIPIRTLQDFRDREKALRVMSALLSERGFDLSQPYTMIRDVALGVYMFSQAIS